MKYITGIVIILPLFICCNSIPEDWPEIPLCQVYEPYFPVGAAVSAGEYGYSSFTSYPDYLLQEYNSITAENCMKPSVIHPENNGEPTDYNWEPADIITDYANSHNMLVWGHVLVWHNQSPAWITEGTKTEVRDKMQSHISAVVDRYKDDISCWDVVNEAISDSGGYRTDSPWYVAYDDATYIQDAFDFASAADPDCKLFYNDYNVMVSGKRQDIVDMVTNLDLTIHGLDGIGIQAHWNLEWPSLEDIETTIDTFAGMGLEVRITELDINCYNSSTSTDVIPYSSVEDDLTQRYDELFALFRQKADEDKLSGVTFWGVADDHTWLDTFYGGTSDNPVRKNYPLLFDEEGSPKEAYYAVHDF